jgi:hypothetical protein
VSSKRFPNLGKLDQEEARKVAAQCKAMRHFMQPESGSGWTPAFGYGIAFRCVNCGTWRFDTRSTITNELLVRSYDASPVYKDMDTQPHAAWMGEYIGYLDTDEVARDPEAPAHKMPGLRNHYPKHDES